MWKRIRFWAVPVAFGLAVLITISETDLVKPRKRPAATPAVSDAIGLAASSDGDGLRLEWNRKASAVRSAHHAVLSIRDGNNERKLGLTAQQLVSSAVRYWPESPQVDFRLKLYRRDGPVAREVRVASAGSSAAPKSGSRVAVERARPSPFEQVKAEVIRQPAQVPAPAPALREEPRPLPSAAPRESGWGKIVSRIPLLRRLKRHPQTS